MTDQATLPRLDIAALRTQHPHVNMRRSINVCARHNVVYVTNQKCGCSTLKLMLIRAELGNPDFVPPKTAHAAARDLLPGLKALGRGRATLFSFIRHPVKRFLSVYCDKARRGPQLRRLGLDTAIGKTDITVDDFLDFIEPLDPLTMDPHWRPQHINLMIDSLRYDLLGRVETFERDIYRLREMTGLPPVPSTHRNKAKMPAPELTAEQVKRIERIYAGDFDLFETA